MVSPRLCREREDVSERDEASYETPIEEQSSPSELTEGTAPGVGDASHEVLYEDPDSDYHERSEEEPGAPDGADSGIAPKEVNPGRQEPKASSTPRVIPVMSTPIRAEMVGQEDRNPSETGVIVIDSDSDGSNDSPPVRAIASAAKAVPLRPPEPWIILRRLPLPVSVLHGLTSPSGRVRITTAGPEHPVTTRAIELAPSDVRKEDLPEPNDVPRVREVRSAKNTSGSDNKLPEFEAPSRRSRSPSSVLGTPEESDENRDQAAVESGSAGGAARVVGRALVRGRRRLSPAVHSPSVSVGLSRGLRRAPWIRVEPSESSSPRPPPVFHTMACGGVRRTGSSTRCGETSPVERGSSPTSVPSARSPLQEVVSKTPSQENASAPRSPGQYRWWSGEKVTGSSRARPGVAGVRPYDVGGERAYWTPDGVPRHFWIRRRGASRLGDGAGGPAVDPEQAEEDLRTGPDERNMRRIPWPEPRPKYADEYECFVSD